MRGSSIPHAVRGRAAQSGPLLARRLVLLTTSAGALPAAAADAATYCVEKPAGNGLDMTFDGALANAVASVDNDRIGIGETTIPATLHLYDPGIDARNLDIVGVGPTKSIFLNQPGVEQPTLRILRGPGGNSMRIASVGLRMSAPEAACVSRGIRTGAVVDDVAIGTVGPQPGKLLEIELIADAVLRDSRSTWPRPSRTPTGGPTSSSSRRAPWSSARPSGRSAPC